MRVLFLDIDGVLNSAEYMRDRRTRRRPTPHPIDATTVPRLNSITDRTGAAIVVSSTWRLAPEGNYATPTDRMRDILSTHGVTGDVIGCTPYLIHNVGDGPMVVQRARGDEIQAWMDCWESFGVELNEDIVESFAILDDGSDMAHLRPWLVQTTWDRGLQDEHVERAVSLLTRGQNG
jgi:hypothetical protein